MAEYELETRTKVELVLGAGSGFVFPITPASVEASLDMENTPIVINDLGEINLKGKRSLQTVSWTCFFPRQYYEFCQVSQDDFRAATDYVNYLKLLEASNTTVTLNITDFISMQATIEGFSYGMDDGSGDINYSITFKEDRDIDTPDAKTQTAKRPTKKVVAHLYKWKKGDTWKKVAKKETGKTENWSKLKKANKSRIAKAKKSYAKKHGKKTVKETTALIGTQVLIK